MLGVLTLCLALSLTVAFPNGYGNWYGNNGYGNWYGNNGYGNWYGNNGYGNWYGNGYGNWYGNGMGDWNGFDNQYDNMNNQDGCFNGWRQYNDHWYCFNRYPMSWSSARESCRGMNGYLVQIENMEENQWLSNYAGSRSYWMGGYCNSGSCMNDEGWYYGNDNQMSYFNWGEGNEYSRNYEGYNGGYCGMFNWRNGGYWWRYMCQQPMMYICESEREQEYGFGKK